MTALVFTPKIFTHPPSERTFAALVNAVYIELVGSAVSRPQASDNRACLVSPPAMKLPLFLSNGEKISNFSDSYKRIPMNKAEILGLGGRESGAVGRLAPPGSLMKLLARLYFGKSIPFAWWLEYYLLSGLR